MNSPIASFQDHGGIVVHISDEVEVDEPEDEVQFPDEEDQIDEIDEIDEVDEIDEIGEEEINTEDLGAEDISVEDLEFEDTPNLDESSEDSSEDSFEELSDEQEEAESEEPNSGEGEEAEDDEDAGGGDGSDDEDEPNDDEDSESSGPGSDDEDNDDEEDGPSDDDGDDEHAAGDDEGASSQENQGDDDDGSIDHERHEIDLQELEEELDEQGYATVASEFLVLLDNDLEERPGLSASRVEEEYRLEGLQMSLYRVRVEGGDDLAEIALEMSEYVERAAADYNHVYESEGEAVTGDVPCIPGECARTLGWIVPDDATLVIGLIDTAVDPSHPSLVGANIQVADFVRTRSSPTDHGTAIASMLVGRDGQNFEGLAPEAQLYAASVFVMNAEGQRVATTESLIRALDWCLAQGVMTINMSLAGPPNRLLELAIRRAAELDAHVIAAVGNAGPAAPPLFPAAYGPVAAVTATDTNFRVYRRANRGAHVDFSAPGVDVLAADSSGAYSAYSGTSFAAPFVSVMIAALSAADKDAAAIDAQLQRDAIDLGRDGFDPIYGHGLIQWHAEAPPYAP